MLDFQLVKYALMNQKYFNIFRSLQIYVIPGVHLKSVDPKHLGMIFLSEILEKMN